MTVMLESHDAEQVRAFRSRLIAHAWSAATDVKPETNINLFWQDLVNCWEAGELPEDCIRIEGDYAEHPPGSPGQKGWTNYRMFLKLKSVLAHMQQWLVKQRGSATSPSRPR